MPYFKNRHLVEMLALRTNWDVDKANCFIRPKLENLHDPFLFNDMEKAVDRLEKAVENNEKILVYGDYDVDGTTAVALVYSFLREFYPFNIFYYVPDRYTEGYGVSFKGVDYAVEKKCTLIIALDCGIKDNARIEYANYKGIDFIVCDHHTPGVELPKAVAVLDAKRADNKYPFDELSGCGVGFKFMQAVCIRRNIPLETLLKYIDLTAVSIGSDIVPIVDENRILAYYGLKKLNGEEFSFSGKKLRFEPLPCFKAVKKEAKLDGKTITMTDSVFMIGPRINAAGRIHLGRDAVRLLTTSDMTEAEKFAKEISDYNQTRKDLDRSITTEALEKLSLDENNLQKSTTVVYGDNWHKGVVGIVASRLTETYFRPTIVFTKIGETLTGSARSVSDFNLYEAIDSCSEFLTAFGGHKFAAGLNLKFENFKPFAQKFEGYVKSHILPSQKNPEIKIEREIDFRTITEDFYKKMKEFEPFGPGNPEPIFCTRGVSDMGSKIVGSDKRHLRLEIVDQTGITKIGIAFGKADFYEKIKNGHPFDICYTLDLNAFNGISNVQLVVKDIKLQ
ncbi:MAG: single-stranded-DNA-specific exonuclease RecJ [Bacteroidales bacterium]|nr:single-stranded-DNA-specific exonuclease RecJ [Bacteroidales bacterium]